MDYCRSNFQSFTFTTLWDMMKSSCLTRQLEPPQIIQIVTHTVFSARCAAVGLNVWWVCCRNFEPNRIVQLLKQPLLLLLLLYPFIWCSCVWCVLFGRRGVCICMCVCGVSLHLILQTADWQEFNYRENHPVKTIYLDYVIWQSSSCIWGFFWALFMS